MEIVIVGGGFAGVKAALELKKNKNNIIKLISDEKEFALHALLYEVASGGNTDDTFISLDDIFKDSNNVKVFHDKITELNAGEKNVSSEECEYSYDKLILALGSQINYFGIENLEKYSFNFFKKDSVSKLVTRIENQFKEKKPDENYIVVGGGPTGVEYAAVLIDWLYELAEKSRIKDFKPSVKLVEAQSRILPSMPKSASIAVQKRLEDLGVKVLTETQLSALDKHTVILNDEEVKSSTVIWTAGFKTNAFFEDNSDNFDFTNKHKIKIDKNLKASEDIFVIGDCADTADTGYATGAINMAEYVANYLNENNQNNYKPCRAAYLVPVGKNWSYAENYGIYCTSILGDYCRKKFIENTAKKMNLI